MVEGTWALVLGKIRVGTLFFRRRLVEAIEIGEGRGGEGAVEVRRGEEEDGSGGSSWSLVWGFAADLEFSDSCAADLASRRFLNHSVT